MIAFQEEHWAEAKDEVLSYWPEHYAEAFGDGEYDPSLELFDAVASYGGLCLVTARREGELVGYMLWFLRPHLLQRTVMCGTLDQYYLRKDARGPRVFQRMVKASQDILVARGVRKAYAMEAVGGRLFKSCGWQEKELCFLRDLSP